MDDFVALGVAALAGAAAAALPALLWHRRTQRVQRDLAARVERFQRLFDALDIGMLVVDADDRVVLWNVDYERLYPTIAGNLSVGRSFESILTEAAELGLVDLQGQASRDWVAARMREHRQPAGPILRRMPDGRWRRITERYLSTGGMVSYSVDVTDQIAKEHALTRAEQMAQQAVTRLREAIEALPAGFELFDAQDRLVLCNARTRQQFPRIWKLFDEQATFEQLIRANAELGGMPHLPCPLDELVAERKRQRAVADGSPVQVDLGDRVYRMHERRTAEGGLVTVRIDITDELASQRNLERIRRRLEDAIDALPDGLALFDADDRLVLCNERYRSLYRESAPAIRPGVRFVDLLRYGLQHGQYPQATGREEAWLAERMQSHLEPGPPVVQELPGNRWLRIDERRTRDGGIAGVRADVTALVRREQALERLNGELDLANARLARMLERDPDTGIASASGLALRLADECARARRHGTPLTLLRLAFDPAPSALDAAQLEARARALAQRLAQCARRPGDLVARIGLDEYVLLLPHTGGASADALLQRCAENCLSLDGPEHPAGRLRIGCVSSDDLPGPVSAEELMGRAEASMRTCSLTWQDPA